MKQRLVILFLMLAVPALANAAGFDSMMPKPLRLDPGEGRETLVSGLRINIAPGSPARVREIAEVFSYELKEQTSLAGTLAVSDAIEPGAVTFILQTTPVPGAFAPESYSLEVGAKGIVIAAASTQGLLWGAQTLLQGIENEGGRYHVRHASITDQPARAWRALMLDPARSFLGLDFIRRTIRVMSAYKMNVLHLHLIDDHSWSCESRAFPKCNRPGEKYYTHDELRELVRHAARYGVEVIPEVDFPGHAQAHVNAYRWLDCEGKSRIMNQAILCAGKASTWEFVEKVIAEMASIFPSRYIHLGGDEPMAIKRWSDCPDCQSRMKAKGVDTLDAFYHTFVIDLNDIAKRHGKQTIVWNDAFHPGVAPMPPRDIIVHAWKDYKNVLPLAADGYTILNASNLPLYFSSFGLAAGLPLSEAKAWDATLFGVRRIQGKVLYEKFPPRAMILGGQALMWATEQGLVEKRLYPRTLCLADTLWAEGRAGDLADFEARWVAHEPRIKRFGVSPEYKHAATPLFENATPGSDPLRSLEKYGDFILTFEMETDATLEFSGITVRDDYKVYVTPPGKTLGSVLRKLKGWKTYELTMRGSVATLTINGYMAWSASNADTRAGHVTVTKADGAKAYRNFTIRKLD